ncbi:hemolysin [Deinococcus irradiatisoli]|uniref:Hemolysin n=1 Tax=Deinococcus irradiatisoli TaxID=2202254 RepID=A0A2Z3JEY9_9DEIO|nr:hemolysin III family protein [Deinococcus irradiatisoli]AWN23602.1 hemolysin [Deinococcus irradiatisoli]
MKSALPRLASSLREPWNGLTHWAGAALAVLALSGMVWFAAAHRLSVWPFVVFGLSMVFLYTASASYHSFRVSERALLRLRKLDHSAIFLLIAGSYTPVAYFGLSGLWQTLVLWIIWGIAISGVALKLLTMRLPRWVSTLLYVVMGWTAVAFLPQLARQLSSAALFWLAVGGALYSVGAVVYATKRWNPRPGVFGFHEIWHLFVLGGTGAHVAMMFALR